MEVWNVTAVTLHSTQLCHAPCLFLQIYQNTMERRHILGKALQVKQRKGHAAIGAIVQRRKNHKMGKKRLLANH